MILCFDFDSIESWKTAKGTDSKLDSHFYFTVVVSNTEVPCSILTVFTAVDIVSWVQLPLSS